MAYVQTIKTTTTRNPAAGDLRARYARWRTYRRTLRELESLNQRELADLGIAGRDLRAVARETVYR